MKARNLIFSLGVISMTAVTVTAVFGLAALSPLKLDPIAAFAALAVAVSGLLWFKKSYKG